LNRKDVYMATICWDGYVDDDGRYFENTDGEQTIVRYSIDDLLEGVSEYLLLFKARDPYLECASFETYEGHDVEKWKDITESVKTILKAKEKHGK
tara:strand:+ start:347 stop:631 length:285 start_codon:yes stop_codon:yes gene_type:complete